MAGVGDRLLSCGHSFCAACLVRIVRIVRIDGDGTPVTDRGGDARQDATITCPTCRQQTRVPGALALAHAEAAQAGGNGTSAMLMHAVSRLPVNVTARAVADSLAAVDWCSAHGHDGGGNGNGNGNGSGSASSASAPSDDPDVVEAWCRHCQRGVCAKCATQHQHSAAVTTQLIPLVEAPQMYRRAIDEQLRALRMREATLAGEWQAMERHRQRHLNS